MPLQGRILTNLAIPSKPDVPARCEPARIRCEADELAVREGYVYSQGHVDLVLNWWRNHLIFIDGERYGDPFEPADWQLQEIIEPIFGWVDRRGRRRIRWCYIELPKKNGKSTLAGAIGLYMMCGDGERRAHVFSAGGNQDQARIVHQVAADMREESGLADYTSFNRNSGQIRFPQMQGSYTVLANVKRGKHGINAHCVISDELHEWVGNEMWQQLKYAFRAKPNSLHFIITNAGDSKETVCYRLRQRALRQLEGQAIDCRFLPLVYSAAAEEVEEELAAVAAGDLSIPVAKRCNPGIGDFLEADVIAADIADAVQDPAELSNMKRLTYGIWEATGTADWIGGAWENCGGVFARDDLAGQQCWGGLDYGPNLDLTAWVLAFRADDGSTARLKLWPHFWVPEKRAAEIAGVVDDFDGWVAGGWITVCPGDTVNAGDVKRRMMADSELFDLAEIVFDPASSELLVGQVAEETGTPLAEFRQTAENYHEPTETFEKMLREGDVIHPNSPVLNWQAENVRKLVTPSEYSRPAKQSKNDIRTVDGIQASIMAGSQALQISNRYVVLF